MAIYDAVAAGWSRSDLAWLSGHHRDTIVGWCLDAEELGELERYRLRLETLRDRDGRT